MAAVTPALGGGLVVKVNSTVLKCEAFDRPRQGNRLPLATSGLTANADGVYEVPYAVGMVSTEIVLRGIYDTAAQHHAAPYNLRPGVQVTLQIGQTSTAMTPAINYKVDRSTDRNTAMEMGTWEASLVQATDSTAGSFTES